MLLSVLRVGLRVQSVEEKLKRNPPEFFGSILWKKVAMLKVILGTHTLRSNFFVIIIAKSGSLAGIRDDSAAISVIIPFVLAGIGLCSWWDIALH